MENNDRQCLYCGKALKGRTDKKFCDDFCRNSYNNERNSDVNNFVRNTNNILRKNRRILKGSIADNVETAKIKREQLTHKGFQFKYLTHTLQTQKGQVYTFCYEYGYLPLEEDWLLIVRQKVSQ